jgi:hypothetical protein
MSVSMKKFLVALVVTATFVAAAAPPVLAQSPANPPPAPAPMPSYLAPYYPPYQPPYAPTPSTYYAPFPFDLLALPVYAVALPFAFLSGFGPYPYSP